MNNLNTRILIVDDQDEIHSDFQEILGKENRQATSEDLANAFLSEDDKNNTSCLPSFELVHASSGDEAYQLAKTAKESNYPFAAAYIDICMPPGMDGIETVRRIREFEKDLEIVIMTGYTDKLLHEITTNMQLPHKLFYIRKPVMTTEIQLITFSLVEKWNVEQAAFRHQQQLALSYQRLKAVLDTTGDAIGVLGSDGKLLFANQQYCQLFDILPNELRQISQDELKTRTKARFRKLKPSDIAQVGCCTKFTNILEEIGDTNGAEPRLFCYFVTSFNGSSDGVVDKVVSYREISKDTGILSIDPTIGKVF